MQISALVATSNRWVFSLNETRIATPDEPNVMS